MQITVQQLINSWESLQKLNGIGLDSGITPVNAFFLSKLIGICQPEVERFNTIHRELFLSLGEEREVAYGDETRKEYQIKEENIDKFLQDITPLLNQTIDLPGNPIPVADLGNGLPLNVGDLGKLSWLFTE